MIDSQRLIFIRAPFPKPGTGPTISRVGDPEKRGAVLRQVGDLPHIGVAEPVLQ